MVKLIQKIRISRGMFAAVLLLCAALVSAAIQGVPAEAQALKTEGFRFGEKLTYDVSFEKFRNVAYAEIYVASNGTLGGKQAVELQGKIKSLNLFSAMFYFFDNTRTVYASEDSGYPMYIRDVSADRGFPEEKITNYLNEPASGFDLLTMLYKVRENGGAGSYSVVENGRVYSFDFALIGGETIDAPAGVFETNLSSVSSNYFEEYGISNVQINLSTDENRLPVQIEFKTNRGSFKALLASSTVIQRTVTPEDRSTPTQNPVTTPTPTPAPSPTPYINDQSLSADFPFKLGEKLRFSVKQNGAETHLLQLHLESRKELDGEDTLVLKVGVNNPGASSMTAAVDAGEVWLDPFTLVPRKIDLRFSGGLDSFNETVVFDQIAGTVTSGTGDRVEVPIGTHSPLSLLYAVRSFGLYPSKDPKNPVNDTRVAVFLNNKPVVLTLRPSAFETLETAGLKTRAQLVTLITGDAAIDSLGPRIWISADMRRLPLRISIGSFQADIIR